MTVIIFANGILEEINWVRPFLLEASLVIAANGGSGHLWRLGHAPDVVIGDLDSLSQSIRTWLEVARVEFHEYAADKDETDLELALQYAVEQSQEKILIFAAAGGRLDQTLANIQLLAHPDLMNRRVELVTAKERAWLVHSETEIHGQVGDLVSLLPLGGEVELIRTVGLQWPLINEVLVFGPARGISNKMTTNSAFVSLASGKLLCIHTPQGNES